MSNIEPLFKKVSGGLFDVVLSEKLLYIFTKEKISSKDQYMF